MSDEIPLTNADRAAILVIALGEDLAGVILSQLTPDLIGKLGPSLQKHGAPSPELKDRVIIDFFDRIGQVLG